MRKFTKSSKPVQAVAVTSDEVEVVPAVATAIPAGAQDADAGIAAVEAQAVSYQPSKATPAAHSSMLTVVDVRVIDTHPSSQVPATISSAAAEAVPYGGPVQPIDGSLHVASSIAQKRIREEAEIVREANRQARGDQSSTASMYSPGDHVTGPIDGDLSAATRLARQRARETEAAIQGGSTRGEPVPVKGETYVDEIAFRMRVRVPEGTTPGTIITVAMPRSRLPGVIEGQPMDVRVPETAPPGSVIEVTFGCSPEIPMTREQRKLIDMEAETNKPTEKERSSISYGSAGGYKVQDYDTQEYRSIYDTDGGYKPAEYKSIYD